MSGRALCRGTEGQEGEHEETVDIHPAEPQRRVRQEAGNEREGGLVTRRTDKLEPTQLCLSLLPCIASGYAGPKRTWKMVMSKLIENRLGVESGIPREESGIARENDEMN